MLKASKHETPLEKRHHRTPQEERLDRTDVYAPSFGEVFSMRSLTSIFLPFLPARFSFFSFCARSRQRPLTNSFSSRFIDAMLKLLCHVRPFLPVAEPAVIFPCPDTGDDEHPVLAVLPRDLFRLCHELLSQAAVLGCVFRALLADGGSRAVDMQLTDERCFLRNLR